MISPRHEQSLQQDSINNTIINTVNCAPGAPRAGDTFVQKYTTKTGVYLGPRSISMSAPDNPLFRDLDDVQATLSYTAGTAYWGVGAAILLLPPVGIGA